MLVLPPGVMRRAAVGLASHGPRTVGTGETFRAMAGRRPVYGGPPPASRPDYTEAQRLYDRALGMSER